jgi:hypothetical protein
LTNAKIAPANRPRSQGRRRAKAAARRIPLNMAEMGEMGKRAEPKGDSALLRAGREGTGPDDNPVSVSHA